MRPGCWMHQVMKWKPATCVPQINKPLFIDGVSPVLVGIGGEHPHINKQWFINPGSTSNNTSTPPRGGLLSGLQLKVANLPTTHTLGRTPMYGCFGGVSPFSLLVPWFGPYLVDPTIAGSTPID